MHGTCQSGMFVLNVVSSTFGLSRDAALILKLIDFRGRYDSLGVAKHPKNVMTY